MGAVTDVEHGSTQRISGLVTKNVNFCTWEERIHARAGQVIAVGEGIKRGWCGWLPLDTNLVAIRERSVAVRDDQRRTLRNGVLLLVWGDRANLNLKGDTIVATIGHIRA